MPFSPARTWRIVAAVTAVVVALLVAAPVRAAGPSASAKPSTWSVVAPGTGVPTVTAAAVGRDRLFMAGNIGGLARVTGPLAAFDPASGEVVPGLRIDERMSDGEVTAVAADNAGGYYVAGDFDGATDATTSVEQPNLLRITAAGNVDARFTPDVQVGDGGIKALAVGSDGTVYIGGDISRVGGIGRTGMAALNGTTGDLRTAFNVQLNGAVTEIELGADSTATTGTAYIAGTFNTARGPGQTLEPRVGAARVRLSTGERLAWDPQVKEASVDGRTVTLERSGSTIYIGGYFAPSTPGEPTVGSAPLERLAAVDAESGAPRASWTPNPDGPVTDIVAVGGDLYVAGGFSQIGTHAINAAALLDAASGAADASWSLGIRAGVVISHILPMGDTVYLASSHGDGEAGALMTSLDGATRCAFAAVSAPNGATPTLRSWNPAPVNRVASSCDETMSVGAMESVGGRIVAGGSFQLANFRARSGLAAIDLTTGAPLPWAPKTAQGVAGGFAAVRAIEVSPDGQTVYLGGGFTAVNGLTSAKNLAAIAADGVADTDTAVRTGWAAPSGEVRALELSQDGSTLFVGGAFARVGTADVARLAAMTTATGQPAGVRLPTPDKPVWQLELAPDGTLFATGEFTTVGAEARSHIAALDPVAGSLAPWNAALDPAAEVEDVAFAGDTVYAVGKLTPAGQGIAALDRATGAAREWTLQPDGATRVRRVSVAPDGTLYLNGNFTRLGPTAQMGVAAIRDGAVIDWRPTGILASYDTGGSRNRPEVLFAGDDVIVGGNFANVSGRPHAGIAVFGPAVAPGAAGPPQITGTVKVGEQVRCVPGRWTGSTPFVTPHEYTWLRGGTPIDGETKETYVLSDLDGGLEVSCRERVRNAAGTAEQTSAPVTPPLEKPVVDVPPAVAGEPYTGREAVCASGLWRNRPTEFRYQWLLDGAPVVGATGQTLLVATTDRLRALSCQVWAKNSIGESERPESSLPVVIKLPPPANVSPPQVLGGDTTGTELTCDPGSWTDASRFSFQWLRDGANIAGATGDRYRAITADAARRLTCRVTAHNIDHSRLAESAPVQIRAGASGQQLARSVPPEDVDDDLPVRVRVRSARLRGRRLRVTVKAPAAGTLSASALIARKGKKARTVAKGRRAVTKRGTVTLNLRLSVAAYRAVKRAGRDGLRLTVKVTLDRQRGRALKATKRVRVRAT